MSSSARRIVFFSPMHSWFASEELWGLTAIRLAHHGCSVSASIHAGTALHPRVGELRSAGVRVQVRPQHYRFWQKLGHRLSRATRPEYLHEVRKLLEPDPPDLVCIETGYPTLPVELMEFCAQAGIPFISTTNARDLNCWPNDGLAPRHRAAFSQAKRNYFVSNASREMTEKQIGCDLPNAEVVWTQYNVAYEAAPAWPESSTLRMACVGRLVPYHKGQDLLLEALARPEWRDRDWHLSLYGKGNWQNSLERIAARLGVQDKVTFAGYADVEDIWRQCQVLVMSSHTEGLPLAMIEAMLCGRPSLATKVGGIPEILQDGVNGFLMNSATPDDIRIGLERLWANRLELKTMGKVAADLIRETLPRDPIGVFADRVIALL